LAEAGKKVLLIEAGRSDRGSWDSWKIHMPSALAFNISERRYNWNFHTVAQQGLSSRSLHQPRGKVFGGSSALNAMAYVRGHAEDYERWARELNTDFWSYDNVLPYYKRLQKHQGEESAYRGKEGVYKVCQKASEETRELNTAFVEAGAVKSGYGKTKDQNGYRQEGFGPMDMSVDFETGERMTSANAYLRRGYTDPAILASVDVETSLQVSRLLFAPTTSGGTNAERPRAIGVEVVSGAAPRPGGIKSPQVVESFFVHGSSGSATSTDAAPGGEVILCAGAVGSAHLLQLAGIGDGDHLKKVDIPVRVHLPDVGRNLEDHLEFYLQYRCSKPVSLYPYASTFGFSKYAFREPWRAGQAGVEWLLTGKGVCASNHFEVGGFVRTTADVPHPDVQFHFILRGGSTHFPGHWSGVGRRVASSGSWSRMTWTVGGLCCLVDLVSCFVL